MTASILPGSDFPLPPKKRWQPSYLLPHWFWMKGFLNWIFFLLIHFISSLPVSPESTLQCQQKSSLGILPLHTHWVKQIFGELIRDNKSAWGLSIGLDGNTERSCSLDWVGPRSICFRQIPKIVLLLPIPWAMSCLGQPWENRGAILTWS